MGQEWQINSFLFLVLSTCITCSFTYVFWRCVIWFITKNFFVDYISFKLDFPPEYDLNLLFISWL